MGGKLLSLQYLRAIAALLVVFHHCFANRIAEQYADWAKAGSWGVDIFFVISGFIIFQTLQGKPFNLYDFAARRFFRIYPLYWIALTGWIVGRLIIPDRLMGADLSTTTVIDSYLLIPHYHLVYVREMWPVLVPGWTLQVELAFYIIFAAVFMLTMRKQGPWLVGSLLVIGLAGAISGVHNPLLATISSPLLWEFMSGVVLASQLPRLQKIPELIAVGLIVASIVISLMYHVENPKWMRALVMGIPAFMIVMGTLSLEHILRKYPLRLLEKLGDASYSLYLFHPLLLGFIAVMWNKLHMPITPAGLVLGFVPLTLVATSVMALVLYKYLEYPMLKFCNRTFLKKPQH